MQTLGGSFSSRAFCLSTVEPVGDGGRVLRGVDGQWKQVFDKQLPHSEPKLRAVFEEPAAKFASCR
jgi:hypothetical protein